MHDVWSNTASIARFILDHLPMPEGSLRHPRGGWGLRWTVGADRSITLSITDDEGKVVQDRSDAGRIAERVRVKDGGSPDPKINRAIMEPRLSRAIGSLLWNTRDDRARLEAAKSVVCFAERLQRIATAHYLGKLTYEDHRDASRGVWAEVEAAGLSPQVSVLVSKRDPVFPAVRP
jgi:hypothetical protein